MNVCGGFAPTGCGLSIDWDMAQYGLLFQETRGENDDE